VKNWSHRKVLVDKLGDEFPASKSELLDRAMVRFPCNKIILDPARNRNNLNKDQTKSTLGHKFDEVNNDESIAKNNKKKSGNEDSDHTNKDAQNYEDNNEEKDKAEPKDDNKEGGSKETKGYAEVEDEATANMNTECTKGKYKQTKYDDSDKMNEDKYCLDLQNNGFKQHTSA
jgi:hypothetical protein